MFLDRTLIHQNLNKMSTTANTIQKTAWALDLSHSELVFKVKHLMISNVTGRFKAFTVTAKTDDGEFSNPADIRLVAEVNSIDTHNEQRDNHLRSADFFDAANHPELIFEGRRYEKNGSEAKLFGDLTIRGNTHSIELDVEPSGVVKDPYGQVKAAFAVSGKISRKEFGLTWNAVTEAGGVVVSDDVKIQAEIQLIKQA